MLSDPITLYKLMILYMLRHVNFPLTNTQLSDFFTMHEYANYFTLQQALNGLVESQLIQIEALHNSTRYEITKEGEDTLSFFENNIPPAIIQDIKTYLEQNRLRMRSEVSVVADYYKSVNQEYVVHCEVREGKSSLIELEVSAPDKSQAEIMCEQWKKKNQEIYAAVMKALLTE